MPDPKPDQWHPNYGSIFQDESVVDAYRHRPEYPPETFPFLSSLIPSTATSRTVLDAGCGTGFIARPLATLVDHIDAVDISERMVAMGQQLPGGDTPTIRWIAAPIETAPLAGPYALIVAAASLHWMDWEQTLPRFAAHLQPGAMLAIVGNQPESNPWDTEAGAIIRRYSMNTEFSPYTMATVAEELEHRHLFRLMGTHQTPPMTSRRSVAEWVESFHARNGLSRDRMAESAATAFDVELADMMRTYAPDGIVEQRVSAVILWGRPLSPVYLP